MSQELRSMTERKWEVESVHPQEGGATHEVSVVTEGHDQTSRYCRGGIALGCSRDYLVPTDMIAITMFLAEHGRKVISIKTKE